MPLDPIPSDEEWEQNFLSHYGLNSVDDWPVYTPGTTTIPSEIRGDRAESKIDILKKFGEIGVLGFSELIEFDDGSWGMAVGDSNAA